MSEPTTITRTDVTMHGIAALRLDAGHLSVTVTVGMGPRILALAGPDGRNVLAELPDARLLVPGSDDYRMLGGHRLWHTPEVAAITYRPDESAVTRVDTPGGVDLVGAVDGAIGIRKRIRVEFVGDRLVLDHEIMNLGREQLSTAPWAITQVPPRGEAWVPLTTGRIDPDGLQPNRSLVLWPYSHLDDARLSLSDDLAVIRGVAGAPAPFKLGTQRRRGWIGHRDGGSLLLIESPEVHGMYGDMGAATQCYTNGDFIELETVGPVTRLEPGGCTTHRQIWRLLAVDADATAADVIASLGLGAA